MSNEPRTVIANLSLSLDGRVCGPAGPFDMGWIVPHAITSGAQDHMVAVTSPATTALLGRVNFEGFTSYWPAVAEDPDADERGREFSRWLTAVDKVVFSTTRAEADFPNTRLTAEDPAEVVARLRKEPGGDIVVLASMSVIRALLAAGEVDRLSITLCPEVVGGGDRLFADGVAASWTLTGSRPTESGALCLVYDRRA
ncbi:riboflavin biosynthesis protein RibD [Actinorhabdospora filicis]|uniref:Riboflavin biosynthesis protein RibD n=1 Tax=Actinorhabdospora filicis TaxID=1785913 RepID=A0A9W6SK83_9ACTN|nr:dihydrofolate reductase family protein [Actinorhabdospora filicis]GLZ77221.1 riboflavin biosynthesis protein RibD [Actinorhabdospora filicis]